MYTKNITDLKKILDFNLRPLISGDYCLLDAPYYHNIGDVLIWQGIHDFCETLPGKNLGTSSMTTCQFQDIPLDATIFLMGGGNFGDLWRNFQEFRLKVIRRYPENAIIMFPQSVWYEDKSLIKRDAEVFESHENLTLCARDAFSYAFLKEYFNKCNILLLPDMAFCINKSLFGTQQSSETKKSLYLKRLDKELVNETIIESNVSLTDIRDWPTFEKNDRLIWLTNRFEGLYYRTRGNRIFGSVSAALANKVGDYAIRKHLVSCGIKFLSPYSEIITTRLHALVLGTLLNKNVKYIDNSTGKLSAFASTWLKHFDNVQPYKNV